MQLFPCHCSHSISLLRTQASCYVTLLLSIIATQCSRCDADPVWSAQTGRRWRGSDFGDTFKWPVLSLATLKGMKLAFHRTARSLRFRGKLTGTKTNLRLRLCSNYTWHVNSREGKQSRKLAAKEDRGEDQEWHGMSLNLTLSSILPCSLHSPMAAALLPTPMVLFFLFIYFFFNSLSWLATTQHTPVVWLCPSSCQSFCLCYRLKCLNILSHCLCTHKWKKRNLIYPSPSTLGDFVRHCSNRGLTLTTAFFSESEHKYNWFASSESHCVSLPSEILCSAACGGFSHLSAECKAQMNSPWTPSDLFCSGKLQMEHKVIYNTVGLTSTLWSICAELWSVLSVFFMSGHKCGQSILCFSIGFNKVVILPRY